MTIPGPFAHTRGIRLLATHSFKAVFPRLIPSALVVQFTVQIAKLKGLEKTYEKFIFSRAENFANRFTLVQKIV